MQGETQAEREGWGKDRELTMYSQHLGTSGEMSDAIN